MAGNVVLVAYSEIALKSEPVRRHLENLLMENLRYMLMRNGLDNAKISRIRGRIVIEGVETEKAANIAARVFGVALAMPAVKTTTSLPDIVDTATTLAVKTISKGQTFAVEARRSGTQSYTSKDIENETGSEILKKLAKIKIRVDLDNPDKKIHVEVRETAAYVYSHIIEGPAGLPLGSQGKVLALFSGGVDSSVAIWLMMKRGALAIPLYFETSPYGDKICRKRAVDAVKFLREYATVADYRLTIVPYGKILTELINKGPRKLTCVLCKRAMYKIACKFAKNKGAKAVVTGESLGQVASQTLHNLSVLDEAASLPIFRPLVGMNKNEIEKLAEKIGIREIVAVRTKRCGAVPIKPTTAAKLEAIKQAEKSLDIDSLVDRALENIKEIIL